MTKGTKLWLIAAAVLVLAGCIILGGVMTVINWNFANLSTVRYETNHHAVSENFHSISIHSDTADIQFVLSADAECSVTCHERKNVTHSVAVKDGTLVIEVKDSRRWYEYIGLQFGIPKITVSLPQAQYTALFIKESTGDIEIPKEFRFDTADISLTTGDVRYFASASGPVKIVARTGSILAENISAGALTLSTTTGKVTVSAAVCAGDMTVSVSTGKVALTDIRCKNLISGGSTGVISLTEVTAEDLLSIVRSTGDVRLDRCDAAEILIKTDTGDVTGTLLSDKVFDVRSDTGKISVPVSVSGGQCKVTTGTGDIRITVG